MKPMIGDDQQHGVRIQTPAHFAEQVVAPPVHLRDGLPIQAGEIGVEHRVTRIDQVPHHVLDPVGRVNDPDQQVPVAAVEPAQDRVRAIVEGAVQVVEKRAFAEAPVEERSGCRGPSHRAERP